MSFACNHATSFSYFLNYHLSVVVTFVVVIRLTIQLFSVLLFLLIISAVVYFKAKPLLLLLFSQE